ncbi:MAG: hypothetical protein RJA57_1951 [Bacteroidota bacterium]|jgi:acetylornithine deacetylase
MNPELHPLYEASVELLRQLIATPSFSREEEATAGILCRFLGARGIDHQRVGNNVFALNRQYDPSKPSILLNSHHDTVRPNPGYTRDPYLPSVEEGKLFGLGSNDAGGCLVSLAATFLHFYDRSDHPYNILFAATAEEEISGPGGIEYTLPYLPPIDCAIVGEPTGMQLAIAERGLMVLDCTSHGKAGHAARREGDNALYQALDAIQWFRTHAFERVSPLLGPCQMTVTVIETENKAHNVVPGTCHFVADIRVNECYQFEEILDEIRSKVSCEVTPRSFRLRSTLIPKDHPLIQAGLSMGRTCYGSPTTSDKALMPFPALKMGPGDSARSHTADEYIVLDEIREGIELYTELLNRLS